MSGLNNMENRKQQSLNKNIGTEYKRKKPMTICIASICNIEENSSKYSPAIVFCADRLVSSSINFEHGNPKIKFISGRCIIMEAGDGTTSDMIIDKDIMNADSSDLNVAEIAEMINDNIIELKKDKIEQKALSDFGLTFDKISKGAIKGELLSYLVRKIEEVKENIQLEFIIAGMDKDGTAQLYKVSDNEGIQCYNSVGFVAIGVGTPLSLLELTKSSHNNYITLNEAVFKTYSAKKGAEKVTGVGKKTDLGFLYLESADKNNENWNVGLIELSNHIPLLDEKLDNIKNHEEKIKQETKKKLDDLIFTKKEQAIQDKEKINDSFSQE